MISSLFALFPCQRASRHRQFLQDAGHEEFLSAAKRVIAQAESDWKRASVEEERAHSYLQRLKVQVCHSVQEISYEPILPPCTRPLHSAISAMFLLLRRLSSPQTTSL